MTDDAKEDWWRDVEFKGRKRIGPRPELIEEIRIQTNLKDFHIYGTEQFLKYAREFLGVEITEQSLADIQRITAQFQKTSTKNLTRRPQRDGREWLGVRNWLLAKRHIELATSAPIFADFSAHYQIKYLAKKGMLFVVCILINSTSDLLEFGEWHENWHENNKEEIKEYSCAFILICPSTPHAEKTCNEMYEILILPRGENETWIVGTITPQRGEIKESEAVFVQCASYGELEL